MFRRFALFEKEFFEAVQDDAAAGLGIDLLENFYACLVLPSRIQISPMPT
jgi:hypothetical protein